MILGVRRELKPVYAALTKSCDGAGMNTMASPLSPEAWLHDLFASNAARNGEVIRRKARDIERFAGWEAFRAELQRRGYRAVENCGQVVIFCNRAPILPLFDPTFSR